VKILESLAYLQQWHKCRWFYCRSHMDGLYRWAACRGGRCTDRGIKTEHTSTTTELQILETEQGATEIKLPSANSPRFTAARQEGGDRLLFRITLLQLLLISRTHHTRAYVSKCAGSISGLSGPAAWWGTPACRARCRGG
jgi:hypothetical protein